MSEIVEHKQSIENQQKEFQNATITVTEAAVKRLNGVMSSDGKEGYFLRMSVEGGGCSGMTYKMDFENKKSDLDKEFNSNGLTIICDIKSWLYLKDIIVDYSDDLLNGGFKIKNPNAERTCGCGTSFSA